MRILIIVILVLSSGVGCTHSPLGDKITSNIENMRKG